MAADQQLIDLYPWTPHRRMQLQGGEDLGPCTCEFCMNLRRDRWNRTVPTNRFSQS